ncbi:HRDC domain-containing protein [Bifidobacterium pullorum]|uniref:HRDC domain-containing protein n=1 Tax=Bifidobacterium pullorum TaxID=78448 RepID=UPI001EF64CC6|nr:HRDC domain-containing protein [Bifidobacterium pullorum]
MTDEPRLQAEPRGGVPDVIDTLPGFHAACDALAAAGGSLAADAERASGFRYGHEDWLVQFKREGAGILLFDPIALGQAGADWQEFNHAVGDATWIIHDAMMDLPGFADLGMRPMRLFDTEIAARLLGMHRFGLAAVTEHYLGVTLAKEHSAADWSYRPLPRDWRNYAALDVELLIELEAAMRADLKAHGKQEWAEEEFAHVLAAGTGPRPERHPVPWMRISHITALGRDRRGLAVAKALWEKRDELAREHDIAPGLLLSDAAIVEAAQRKPRNAREFRAIRSLNERVRMHTGGEQDKMFERYAPIQRSIKPSVWKETIQRALALPDSGLPTLPRSGGRNENEGNAPKSMRIWQTRHPARYKRLERVRRAINRIAEDTRTPADVLIRPQIVRNLCWQEDAQGLDVASFLASQGARDWQVRLISASVARAMV